MNTKRFSSAALLAAFSLLLSGCFFTPGKFTSELTLKQDNSFEFSYTGEIFFLGLSQLAQMGAASDADEFEGGYCFDEETFEDRDCTAEETAEQKAEWDANADARAASSAKEIEQMGALMGGLDLSDPEAGAEMAAKLERQRGWHSVEHVGNGVFNVEFSTRGQLSHDFVFPMMEGFPLPTQFVQLILRDGNQIRVEAPGFAAQDNAGGMPGMMGGMTGLAALAAAEEGGDAFDPGFPKMDGTFTIVTDGQILANNTDEGPAAAAGGEALRWDIDSRTKAAPTALIQLGR